MKKLLAFTFIFFSILLTSCSKKQQGFHSASSAKPLKIGFSIDTLIVERWKQDCELFISTAGKNGASVIIKDAANSVTEQIKQVDSLISQNVDVLVIVPKEASALSGVLLKARKKNIPVISYDRLILDAPVSLYVSVDSFKVGKLMAEGILKGLDKGSIWSILGSSEDNNMKMIEEGIHSGLAGSKVSEEFKFFTPDWNYDLAYAKMNGLLDDGLIPSGVICGNDAIAESVLKSISEHRLGMNIPIVGQDADILACRRIVAGLQAATVYKPIQELASIAAECACRIARGAPAEECAQNIGSIKNGYGTVPALLLEPVLLTGENMMNVVVKSGFHSYDEIYR